MVNNKFTYYAESTERHTTKFVTVSLDKRTGDILIGSAYDSIANVQEGYWETTILEIF